MLLPMAQVHLECPMEVSKMLIIRGWQVTVFFRKTIQEVGWQEELLEHWAAAWMNLQMILLNFFCCQTVDLDKEQLNIK